MRKTSLPRCIISFFIYLSFFYGMNPAHFRNEPWSWSHLDLGLSKKVNKIIESFCKYYSLKFELPKAFAWTPGIEIQLYYLVLFGWFPSFPFIPCFIKLKTRWSKQPITFKRQSVRFFTQKKKTKRQLLVSDLVENNGKQRICAYLATVQWFIAHTPKTTLPNHSNPRHHPCQLAR